MHEGGRGEDLQLLGRPDRYAGTICSIGRSNVGTGRELQDDTRGRRAPGINVGGSCSFTRRIPGGNPEGDGTCAALEWSKYKRHANGDQPLFLAFL